MSFDIIFNIMNKNPSFAILYFQIQFLIQIINNTYCHEPECLCIL